MNKRERFETENNIPVYAEYNKRTDSYGNSNKSELGLEFRRTKIEELNNQYFNFNTKNVGNNHVVFDGLICDTCEGTGRTIKETNPRLRDSICTYCNGTGEQPECEQHTLRNFPNGDYKCTVCGIISTGQGYKWPKEKTEEEVMKPHYAKYALKKGNITKDGHVMFQKDIVRDLNRKSYLESILEEK